MPLRGRTWTYEYGDGPDQIGVYELFYAGNLVRIGSGRIRSRLKRHHTGLPSFQRYRCKITNSKRRAIQIERRELTQFRADNGRLPKYNYEVPNPP